MFTNSKNLRPNGKSNIGYYIYDIESIYLLDVFYNTNQADEILRIFNKNKYSSNMILFASETLDIKKYAISGCYKNVYSDVLISVELDRFAKEIINNSNNVSINVNIIEKHDYILKEAIKTIELVVYA